MTTESETIQVGYQINADLIALIWPGAYLTVQGGWEGIGVGRRSGTPDAHIVLRIVGNRLRFYTASGGNTSRLETQSLLNYLTSLPTILSAPTTQTTDKGGC